MSVRERFDDALFLMRGGRPVGALLSLLVAIAATSRKRFPLGSPSARKPGDKMGDGEAFETFFAQAFAETSPIKTSGGMSLHYRGKQDKLEHIFYKAMRCQLAHEGALPDDVALEFAPNEQGWSVRSAGTGPNEPIRFTQGWLLQLSEMVGRAPENAAAFADILARLPRE